MNTRPLTAHEELNLSRIKESGLDYALLFITETGLKKSILDATQPVRTLLSSKGIHSYSNQGKGPFSKITLESTFILEDKIESLETSLYRPKTKKGDPRIWFRRLGRLAAPNDILALFVLAHKIHVINLTKLAPPRERTHQEETQLTFIDGEFFHNDGASPPSQADQFFKRIKSRSGTIASELLGKLKRLASAGSIDAVCTGDTAIGRSVESALGIRINSERTPDYKGIEIKAGRSSLSGRGTRQTLFACVPDWDISTCKSSKEILNKYGYQREDSFKLYCTVSAKEPNSQQLQLHVSTADQLLHEIETRPKKTGVAAWRLEKLHKYLTQKHTETFWISALSERVRGKEKFHLKSVIHTRNPSLPQFDILLANGTITLDHLIKEKNGRVSEKGPLFKIPKPRIPDLFHLEPKKYDL